MANRHTSVQLSAIPAVCADQRAFVAAPGRRFPSVPKRAFGAAATKASKSDTTSTLPSHASWNCIGSFYAVTRHFTIRIRSSGNRNLEANGETNAHFVVRQLWLENVDAVPAIIGRDQSTRDSFLVPVPNVVVMHRSTFESSNGGDGDTAIALLIAAAPKTTRFVFYSRKTGTDEGYAQMLEARGGAQGRVAALTLKKGDPWADPA